MPKPARQLVVLFAFALSLLACASAPAGDWELLGSRVVNDRAESDEIAVTAARGDFTAVKLAVRRAAVRFYDVKIHFGNGAIQDVELRDVIPAGGESRVIDVRGGDRVIRRVTFRYEAASRGRRRAEVFLYGRR